VGEALVIGHCPVHGLLDLRYRAPTARMWLCPFCNAALNARIEERLATLSPIPPDADPFEALVTIVESPAL